MIKFKVQQTTEKINANGGLTLVGRLLKRCNLKKQSKKLMNTKRTPVFSDHDVIQAYLGLLAMGKTAYEDIAMFKENKLFCKALGIKHTASPETIRQRLDTIAQDDNARNIILKSNINFLRKEQLGTVKTQYGEYIPLDADVSPMDNSKSNKEGCSFTYKKHDGFAPMLAYIGTQGHMLNNELRPGKQHCQSGTPEFLSECLEMTDKLKITDKVLLRLDSGNDAADNFPVIHHKCRYIIKRNLRHECPEQWLALAKRVGTMSSPREGKKCYTGVTSHKVPGNREDSSPVDVVFEVTVRTIDRNGQPLLINQIEVSTYWTNLPDDAESIIRLYHDHGTSEQFHSELKTDMDVERLPSGNFATNKLILSMAMLSFNALKTIGQDIIGLKEYAPIKIDVKRRRIRSVLQDIIYSACKYVEKGGYHYVKFGCECAWYAVIQRLYIKYV